jgi:hypothetical protein
MRDMRVALVGAEQESGEISWVSGYLIGDRLVVTVRSLVADSVGRAATVQVRVLSAPQARRSGQVIWDNAQLGIMLVALADATSGVVHDAVRFARLRGPRRRIGCEVRSWPAGTARSLPAQGYAQLDGIGQARTVPVHLKDGHSGPLGAAVICGNELFGGLVTRKDAESLAMVPADVLLGNTGFVDTFTNVIGHAPDAVPAYRGTAALAATFGLLIGILGLFTGVVQGFWRVAALLLTCFSVSVFAWRVAVWIGQRRAVGPRHRVSPWTVVVLMLLLVTVLADAEAWAPQHTAVNVPKRSSSAPPARQSTGPSPQASQPFCTYSVDAATSDGAVPIVLDRGGSIQEAFQPEPGPVTGLYFVVGLDPVLANLDLDHDMTLVLWSADEKLHRTFHGITNRADNNGQTGFFPEQPISLEGSMLYYLQIINTSTEPVGVYAKPESSSDRGTSKTSNIVIRGERLNHAEHLLQRWALSACIETR